MMAAFKRPTARTKIKGLYLVGGGRRGLRVVVCRRGQR